MAAHDRRSGELARYKLGAVTATDPDGYHRVACPAVLGKVRCPLRADSIALTLDHPEVLAPPEHPPTCCTQVTITVPPQVNAKTVQRHDYPGKAWRRSYARRSAAERSNARIKDPATIDVARGWCRVMGLTPMSLFLACALVVRNLAAADAFGERQRDAQCRAAAGLSPRTAGTGAGPWPTSSARRPTHRRERPRLRGNGPALDTARPRIGASGSSSVDALSRHQEAVSHGRGTMTSAQT